jgi:hypothetical protein
MICLHHVGVYLHVALCVNLELYLIFSMLVMSCSGLVEIIIMILTDLRLFNDRSLVMRHEICEGLISVDAILHLLVAHRTHYTLMLILTDLLLLSSLTLPTYWIHLLHLLLL